MKCPSVPGVVRALRDRWSGGQARTAGDPSVRDDVIEGLRVVWADREFMHGLVLVAEVNQQFDLHIDQDTYTTVGGFVLGRLTGKRGDDY